MVVAVPNGSATSGDNEPKSSTKLEEQPQEAVDYVAYVQMRDNGCVFTFSVVTGGKDKERKRDVEREKKTIVTIITCVLCRKKVRPSFACIWGEIK